MKRTCFINSELTTIQLPGFVDCGVARLVAVEIDEAESIGCYLNRLGIVAKQL